MAPPIHHSQMPDTMEKKEFDTIKDKQQRKVMHTKTNCKGRGW